MGSRTSQEANMNGQTKTVKLLGNLLLTGFFFVFASGTALAQVPVDEDGNTIPAYYEDDLESVDEAKLTPADGAVLSSAELEELVGPVALYPDDLLAIVLPASTYPLEIVQAARFLERLQEDSSLKPDEEWDESIVALLNYPDVVNMMDEDIDWTWRLGEAVIGQQTEVIAAVEAFRDRAYAAGNLKTDENQTVTYDEGTIEIAPVNEEIIYVPFYEPEEVVVYQPRPVYHYYPNPYPVYYYPYPLGYSFSSGYFWGVTTAFHIGWSNHYLHVYHPTYWGHPYYGRTYYDHYYRRPSIGIYNTWYVNNNYRSSSYRYRDGDYWRPRSRAGSRQDEPRVRNYHYPPGGDRRRDNRRRDSDYSARNQLNNRDNGRLPLNLRERSESDRTRVAATNNVRPRAAGESINNRSNSSRDRTAATAASNSNRNQQTRAQGGNNSTRAVDADNRARVAPANPRVNQDRNRATQSGADIQFRDRSNENRTNNTRNSFRSDQSQSVNRQNASARNNSASVSRQRETVAPRATAPRTSAPSRTSAPRVTAPRTSAPSRTSAPRAQAPSRSSAPRVQAPSRSSAPRVQAPSRASAPRASAPQRAPSGSNRSSGQGSSRASQGSSRSSSSSRPRNRSN